MTYVGTVWMYIFICRPTSVCGGGGGVCVCVCVCVYVCVCVCVCVCVLSYVCWYVSTYARTPCTCTSKSCDGSAVCVHGSDPRFIQFAFGSYYAVHIKALSIPVS